MTTRQMRNQNSITVYENPAEHKKVELKLPLQSLINPRLLADEIGIPKHVQEPSFGMNKILAILSACHNPRRFIEGSQIDEIKVGLFGGAGFKLHCPSSNMAGPFYRDVRDIDLITLFGAGEQLIQLLVRLNEKCGNMYSAWTTSGDDIFNIMRGRRRFRIHTIEQLDENGNPLPGIMDIICGQFSLCHLIDVLGEIQNPSDNYFTIRLENLILTKAQLIMKAPKSEVERKGHWRNQRLR